MADQYARAGRESLIGNSAPVRIVCEKIEASHTPTIIERLDRIGNTLASAVEKIAGLEAQITGPDVRIDAGRGMPCETPKFEMNVPALLSRIEYLLSDVESGIEHCARVTG